LTPGGGVKEKGKERSAKTLPTRKRGLGRSSKKRGPELRRDTSFGTISKNGPEGENPAGGLEPDEEF